MAGDLFVRVSRDDMDEMLISPARRSEQMNSVWNNEKFEVHVT